MLAAKKRGSKMAEYFTTASACQARITKAWQDWGRRLSVPQALYEIYASGCYQRERPLPPHQEDWRYFDEHQFIDLLGRTPIELNHIIIHQGQHLQQDDPAAEESMFAPGSDILAFRAFNFVANPLHQHNFLEMAYVYRGSCRYQLRNAQYEKELRTGQFLIIGPQTPHALTVDNEDAVVLILTLRQSTFQQTFFGLLQGGDLLSHFFQFILARPDSPNYLLFTTHGERPLRELMQSLIGETCQADRYYNNCSSAILTQFFTFLLRHYSQSLQFDNYDFLNTRFPILLKYIQQHFRTVTLKDLSREFHYSATYLSTLIHENSGQTFSALLTNLKLTKAQRLLQNSAMSIQEISAAVGYSSAGHFSRTFHNVCKCTPLEYRQAYRRAVEQGNATLMPQNV
jgi:AraC-like DNA-binding protein